MSETISVSYKSAEKEGLIGKVYLIWIDEVPHLDQMTRGIISREWEKNNIQLVVPIDKLNE